MNGEKHFVPMATTEGALIASTNRGARAITASGGVSSVVVADGMTRAPVFKCVSVFQAAEVKAFVESPEGLDLVRTAFSTTTKHGKMEVFHCVSCEPIVDPLLRFWQSSPHAAEGQRWRCHGHEHADEGVPEGRRRALRSFPRITVGIALGQHVMEMKWTHAKVLGQEAVGRELAPGKRQVGDM